MDTISAEYMICLAETHPDALPDYSNPEDYVTHQCSDPFQPFEEDDPVGGKQSDKDGADNSSHNGGEILKENDMETENTGTLYPDNNTLGEDDMDTGDNGAPFCPDDSTLQLSTPAQRNQRNSETTTVVRQLRQAEFHPLNLNPE